MLSAVSIVNLFSVYSFENYKLSHKSIIYHLTVEISKIISFYLKLTTRKSVAAIIISLFCSYSDLDESVSVLALTWRFVRVHSDFVNDLSHNHSVYAIPNYNLYLCQTPPRSVRSFWRVRLANIHHCPLLIILWRLLYIDWIMCHIIK